MAEKHIKKHLLSRDRVIKFVLAFALLWFFISFVLSAITGMMIKTTIIGKKTVENVVTPYGMVTYDSYTIASPLSGQGSPIIEEGVRVRKNEAVFRVTAVEGSAMQGETEKIMYAPLAGLVSYHVDGYEDIKTLEEARGLDLKAIYKAQEDKVWDSVAAAGTNYAKIINSFDDIFIYLDCESNSYTQTFEPDLKIRIRFPEINYSTICRIVEAKPVFADDAEHIWVKADLGTADQAVFGQRVWQVELPYDVARVIEIDKEAVVYQNGQPGVYALEKGFAYWKAINITEERENTYIVEDMAEGTEIVTTPKLVGEGERVKVK